MNVLNTMKEEKSKLNKLNYSSVQMQGYLSDSRMSNRHKKLAFQARTHMLKTSSNFGNKTTSCPLGCDSLDSRGNLESYVHFMESYVHFMRIAIAKALESTRGLLKNFKECTWNPRYIPKLFLLVAPLLQLELIKKNITSSGIENFTWN